MEQSKDPMSISREVWKRRILKDVAKLPQSTEYKGLTWIKNVEALVNFENIEELLYDYNPTDDNLFFRDVISLICHSIKQQMLDDQRLVNGIQALRKIPLLMKREEIDHEIVEFLVLKYVNKPSISNMNFDNLVKQYIGENPSDEQKQGFKIIYTAAQNEIIRCRKEYFKKEQLKQENKEGLPVEKKGNTYAHGIYSKKDLSGNSQKERGQLNEHKNQQNKKEKGLCCTMY